MADLIHDHRVSPPNTFATLREEEVRAWFQRGQALFARNWPYAWSLHQSAESPVAGKVGIAPLPHFPGGESVATLGGWHVAVSASSDAPDASWALVKYITSRAVQKRLALRLGWNPGRRDVYRDPDVLAALPHFADLEQVFTHARPRPNVPYYTAASEILQRELNAVLAGRRTPAEGLAAAQAQIEAVADRYRTP